MTAKPCETNTQENCDVSTKLGIKYEISIKYLKTAVNGEGLNS